MEIRKATGVDVPRMLQIYQYYVTDTQITFEINPPSLCEFQRRFDDKIGKYPWLACEIDGQVVGYAYADAYRTRPAYAWSVETSVYVDINYHRKGVGKKLYKSLLDILKAQGFVNVIGGLTLPNIPSQKLHEHFGFVQVAQFKDAGFKLGKWWDVGYWQLQFQKPMEPRPLAPPTL